MINKRLRCQKGEHVALKNHWRKIKSQFLIYACFESISVPKKKLGEKYKWVLYKQISKHVAYSYCSKLISIDDKFSKPKSYLGEDAVCNFINNTVQESQYCSEVMQRQFNKDFAITITDDEDF